MPDVLAQYFTDVRRHRLLSRQEEVRLSQAVAAGKEAAARLSGTNGTGSLAPGERTRLVKLVRAGEVAEHEFVQANLRLVIAIAKRYRSSGLPLEDLVQEGNLGLLRAVSGFDWRRGFRFSTYASWWIRQAIAHGIRTSAHTIYRPAHVCERMRAVDDAQRRLEVTLGRRPWPGELAAETGMPERQVIEALTLAPEPRSLSEPVNRDEEDTRLADLVPDPAGDLPFEHLAATLLPADLDRFLSPLTDREHLVLELRYGLSGDDPLTLSEVARRLGLTSQRISQVTEAAKAKLLHPSWRQEREALRSSG